MLGISCLMLAGSMRSQQFSAVNDTQHITHDTTAVTYYTAKVIEPTREKNRSYQTTIAIEKVLFSGETDWKPRQGKMLVYQSKTDSSHASHFQYGDVVMIKGSPAEIPPPTNPGQFDYRQYLSFQNIHHQQFVRAGQIVKFEHRASNPFIAFAYRMQEKCNEIFDKHIIDIRSRGIAKALILGVKDGLDNEIREAYAAAGAMHVLAVSGLHVGIIYLIISFLFSFTKKLPGGNWLHAVLCLLIIWIYALVTGLSPSVLRAATMFSFIIVAQAARRQTNIYNTLAASAFFLLCLDPYLIVSVGFQLSYLAVAGIVYLQPKIYRWLEFDHWLPDKIWQLTAVSVAAQLATFPLGLYYFHQFPVYFWLANVFVIPAAFLILSGGLVVLLLGSLWQTGAAIAGFLLEKFIEITNQGILWIEKLPFSIVSDWVIDGQQTILIYGMISCFLLLFHYRKFKFLVYAFGCVSLLIWLDFSRFMQQNDQQLMTFYNIYGESSADFSYGKNSFLLGAVTEKTSYVVNQTRVRRGSLPLEEFMPDATQLLQKEFNNLKVVAWQGKKIIFISQPCAEGANFSQQIAVDYVVISQDAVRNLKEITQAFTFTKLIIDSSNRHFTVKNLLHEAHEQGIDAYAVSDKGAYVVNLAHD